MTGRESHEKADKNGVQERRNKLHFHLGKREGGEVEKRSDEFANGSPEVMLVTSESIWLIENVVIYLIKA